VHKHTSLKITNRSKKRIDRGRAIFKTVDMLCPALQLAQIFAKDRGRPQAFLIVVEVKQTPFFV